MESTRGRQTFVRPDERYGALLFRLRQAVTEPREHLFGIREGLAFGITDLPHEPAELHAEDRMDASASPRSAAPEQRLGAVFNALPRERRPSAVTAYMAREIAERLRIGVEDLEVDLPLERLGFDSLQATELQARLLEDLGVRIPVMRFLGFSSIASIAQEVVEHLENVYPLRPAQTVWPMLESDVRTFQGSGE